MWIPGLITTVHNEHFCRELAAVARIGLIIRRWLSDKNRSADVVLGKHPYCVSWMCSARKPVAWQSWSQHIYSSISRKYSIIC
jgi:hypothetical protein